MGKPGKAVYDRFSKKFYSVCQKIGKEQYLVPYLMSSHPGSTIHDAIELALYIKKNNLHPEQVQDFYPTPGTISTCMYYTGIDPQTYKPVYVAKDPHEKAMQRALLQWARPEKRRLVIQALHAAGRTDLIGYGKECLVRPEHGRGGFQGKKPADKGGKSADKGGKPAGKSGKPAAKNDRKDAKGGKAAPAKTGRSGGRTQKTDSKGGRGRR